MFFGPPSGFPLVLSRRSTRLYTARLSKTTVELLSYFSLSPHKQLQHAPRPRLSNPVMEAAEMMEAGFSQVLPDGGNTKKLAIIANAHTVFHHE